MIHIKFTKQSLLLFLIPQLILGLLLMLFYQTLWGNPLPSAAYGSDPLGGNPILGALGQLFDQEFGLFFYSPIYIIGFIGMFALLKKSILKIKSDAVLMSMVFLSIYFVTSSYAGKLNPYDVWGGWSPPPRYLVPVLPLLGFFMIYCINTCKDKIFVLIYRLLFAISFIMGMGVWIIQVLYGYNISLNWGGGTNSILEKINMHTHINLSQFFPSFTPHMSYYTLLLTDLYLIPILLITKYYLKHKNNIKLN